MPDPADSPRFSKRAARRLIQRAFVLTGRDKHVRQHIREAHLTSLWVLQEWDLTWTVVLDRGRIHFERRPARKPDVTLIWDAAEDFFDQAEGGTRAEGGFQFEGRPELKSFVATLLKGFFASLRHVLRDPVDDVGESLL